MTKRLPLRWKAPEIVGGLWCLLALAVLAPVTSLLQGSFPVFTVVWILAPLLVIVMTKDAGRVGFRIVPWRQLLRVTALNLAALLALMLLFEPWSHTYQKLLAIVLTGQPPDTTFGWLLRYPKLPALAAMLVYSGLVTLFGEELFFRGWLLQLLQRRWGARWAISLQALLFTLPNLLVASMLPALQGVLYGLVYTWLAIGVVGGWAASQTGSLWPSLISATLCNFVLVVVLL